MLGVLKRRWRPKRSAANNNNNTGGGRLGGKPGLDPETDRHRTPTSPRQIHPVCEEKLHLVAYDSAEVTNTNTETSALPGGPPLYPTTPNICVEGGRIEFIKPPPDCAHIEFNKAPLDVVVSPPPEKTDVAKECLEDRIRELEAALEAERLTSQRERLLTVKLQRQLARREVLQRDVDRERRLRLDSECRLRTSTSETERCRARLAALQREFSRMEETVRSMLQYKTRYDQLRQDKQQTAAAYENRVQQFQHTLSKLNQENEALKKQLHSLEATGGGEVQAALVERLRVLERDNSCLSRDSEVQRRQYERCLDDVANQVVRALLQQKGLREEIGGLQQRVRELETQNQTLSSLLLQQLTSVTTSSEPTVTRPKPAIKFALPAAPGRPISCDDSRLRLWEDSVVWLPLQRPASLSLSLDTCCQYRHRQHTTPALGGKEEDEGSESPESGNRDEGYSTMSSDVQGLAEAPRGGLEELKEATDETDTAVETTSSSPDRLPEPDLVLIPLSVALSVGSGTNRHSYPPVRDLLPFQHAVRSLSDSHLCLKLGPAPAPAAERQTTSARALDDDSGSWCSGDWWDADYVQHWLRLDETRSALQQQMSYDAAELEDWTMEEEVWRREPLTHSQTLPSIQESIAAELEEDNSECLWNSSSYLVDGGDTGRNVWPYANRCLVSPGGDSWSSAGSKRSSAALSTDSGDVPAIGTDFTRDFYRLVKFESTKSLASTSSRSQAGESAGLRRGELPVCMTLSSDREQALQSVLHFIAEQQQYVLSREVLDTRPSEISLEEMSPEYSDEFSPKESPEEALPNYDETKRLSFVQNKFQNNPNKKRPLSEEIVLNEYNESSTLNNCENQRLNAVPCQESIESLNPNILPDTSLINATTDSSLRQNPHKESNVPLDKLKTDKNEDMKSANEKVKSVDSSPDPNDQNVLLGRSLRVDVNRLRPVPEEDEDHPTMSESFTSTISTPETVLKVHSLSSSEVDQSLSMAESTDSTAVFGSDEPVLVNNSKTLSFHERATSKDVIDELNRMIRKGEDSVGGGVEVECPSLDTACCCPTGWVHVERDIDFTDPKMRANLLDVMLAASHSSSSPSSSSSSSPSSHCSSPNNSDSGEDPPDYQHLHRLHRFRRQKKASATREPLGALRCAVSAPRPSIIGRDDFFVRYGDKEREAVASFDFLEELSTASSSCDHPSPSADRAPSFSDSCASGSDDIQ